MLDLTRRPAESAAGAWVLIVLAGLVICGSRGGTADSFLALSEYAFAKILVFSFVSSVLGVLLIILSAYICAYVVMYVHPWARIPATAIFIAVFSLSYYSILQSLLAWVGPSGIIESVMPDFEGVLPIDWRDSMVYVVISTLPGYLWRYLPVAFFFISFGLLSVPRSVVLAAENMLVPSLKIHCHIIGRQIAPIVTLLIVFLFLTLTLDASSVTILGRGLAETFGSALNQSATSSTLVGSASLIGIIYLAICVLILMRVTTSFRHSPEVKMGDGNDSLGSLIGARRPAAGYVALAFMVTFGLVILTGLIFLSLGFGRTEDGFFSASDVSLEGFRVVFSDESYRKALFASLWLGAAVASISVVFGLISAWRRFSDPKATDRKRRGLYDAILVLPLLLPGVLASRGVAEVREYLPSGDNSDWVIAAFLHCGLFVSISYFFFLNSFSSIGRGCLYAASNMNLTELRICGVYVRASMPALMASWFATFAFSVNEFTLTAIAFTNDSSGSLAARLDHQRQTGLSAIDFSAVTLLSGVALLMLAISGLFVSKWSQPVLEKLRIIR